jgi:hypothetical protein
VHSRISKAGRRAPLVVVSLHSQDPGLPTLLMRGSTILMNSNERLSAMKNMLTLSAILASSCGLSGCGPHPASAPSEPQNSPTASPSQPSSQPSQPLSLKSTIPSSSPPPVVAAPPTQAPQPAAPVTTPSPH